MASTLRHMCIDVRGVLNWKSNKLTKLFVNDDGSKATIHEVRNYLYDKLKEGFEVIPLGNECDNFDKVKGCLGHPVNEEK